MAAYAPEGVEGMEKKAVFLNAGERGEDVALTDDDRTYLTVLRLHLDTYPEMRATTQE